MPDLVIVVDAVVTDENGVFRAQWTATASNRDSIPGETVIDPGTSATQTNADLINGAKAALTAALGTSWQPNDRTLIFGGRS